MKMAVSERAEWRTPLIMLLCGAWVSALAVACDDDSAPAGSGQASSSPTSKGSTITARNGALVVDDKDRACTKDEDCAMISITGGSCGGNCAAVNVAHRERYQKALVEHGLTTPDGCDYDCREPALEKPQCKEGMCRGRTEKDRT